MSPLRRHYRAAPPAVRRAGAAWYAEARALARQLARENGITVRQAAGIIASASMNQTWKGNVTLARKLCAGELVGLSMVKGECADILAGMPPSKALVRRTAGKKRLNFYFNIVGDLERVTIDRWAARAADMEADWQKPGGYERIAAQYVSEARALGISPCELQAIVWIQVRGTGA